MYLLNAETTLEWELTETSNPPALGDLNLIFINPEGQSEFIETPFVSGDYTPPTPESVGSITYLFTPQLEGFWRIRLVTGTATSYNILAKMEMYVFDSTTTTSPYSEDIGRPTPYDVNFYLQGFVVPGEIYGSFVASRSISFAEDVPNSEAICETASEVSPTIFEILHNGVVVGQIEYPVDSFVGIITMNSIMISQGDKLQIKVSQTVDDSISDIAINLVGCCTIVPCSVF